jgi:hypothetical protein
MERDSCEVHAVSCTIMHYFTKVYAVFGNIFAKFLGGSGGNFGKMLA